MNRTRIQYFLHLAKSLKFSDTARAFHVTQPALSKAIKRLEDDLGGTLIRREGRLTHLTPLGRAMVERLQDVETATRQAERAAQRLTSEGAQQINIAVMCTVSSERLMPFMAKLRRDHPGLTLTLDDIPTDKIVDILLMGHCDIAICAQTFDSGPRLKQLELYREEMVVISPPGHRFAARDSVSLNELEGEPYIDRLNCEFRSTFNEAFRSANVMPDVVMQSEREDWVADAVRSDMGVTFMPRDAVDPQLYGCCRLAPEPYWRTVSMAVATGREDNETVRAVLKAARDYDWNAAVEAG